MKFNDVTVFDAISVVFDSAFAGFESFRKEKNRIVLGLDYLYRTQNRTSFIYGEICR